MANTSHDFFTHMNKQGRSDQDLKRMAARLPSLGRVFRGVFAKDELPLLKPGECCIVNLQNSVDGQGRPLSGTHWIACGRHAHEPWAFDSYGLPPPLEVLKAIGSNGSLAMNKRDVQAADSVYCGDYALGACLAMASSTHNPAQKTLDRYTDLFNHMDLKKNDQVLENYLSHSQRHTSGSGIVYESYIGGNH